MCMAPQHRKVIFTCFDLCEPERSKDTAPIFQTISSSALVVSLTGQRSSLEAECLSPSLGSYTIGSE